MRRSSSYPWTYIGSRLEGAKSRQEFDTVEQYAMFIGHPRSGTSLVGSMLNAHPNVQLAHELNALRYVARGYNREQIFWLLKQRDVEFGESGRNWTGYDYSIPGQWQGKTTELKVIGDKKAGAASELIGNKPHLLERLKEVVQVPVKMVHVVRNPFNVITTVHRKRRKTSLQKSIQMYFKRCQTNQQLCSDKNQSVFTLRLEDLIAEPVQRLTAMCQFLNVDPASEYLEACREKLFGAPHQSQLAVAWPRDLIESVEQQMRAYSWLEGYRFLGVIADTPSGHVDAPRDTSRAA